MLRQAAHVRREQPEVADARVREDEPRARDARVRGRTIGSPRSGIPRPAWKSTGRRCSPASATSSSTAGCGSAKRVAARMQLEAPRAGRQAAARLLHRIGRLGVDPGQRDQPAAGLRARAQAPSRWGPGSRRAPASRRRAPAAGRRRPAPRSAPADRPRTRRDRGGRCGCGRRTTARPRPATQARATTARRRRPRRADRPTGTMRTLPEWSEP